MNANSKPRETDIYRKAEQTAIAIAAFVRASRRGGHAVH